MPSDSTNPHLDFLRVTEAAALSSSRWVGKGDRHGADTAACDAMRRVLNELDMNGEIVIGEGERDEAPMLYIGEKVGLGNGGPVVQIAVDPLEGTNLCANGTPNAISVLAAAVEGEGYLMHAPDCYMDKLVVGAEAAGVIDITLPPRVNCRLIAKALGKDVDELIIGLLERDRHQALIDEIRAAGARVHMVPDGDLSVAIAALDPEAGIDALMGIGGAPEGVLSAAAVLCYGGEMQARLSFPKEGQRAPLSKLVGAQYGVPGLKAALNLCGFVGGLPRPPLLPAPPAAIDAIRAALAELNLLSPTAQNTRGGDPMETNNVAR